MFNPTDGGRASRSILIILLLGSLFHLKTQAQERNSKDLEAQEMISNWIAAGKKMESFSRIGCTLKYGAPPVEDYRVIDRIKDHLAVEVKKPKVDNSPPKEYANIKNPHYLASLERHQDSGGWLIDEVLLASDKNVDELGEDTVTKSDYFRLVSTCSGILEYFSLGKYKITSVQDESFGDNTYLVIEATLEPDSMESPYRYEYVRLWFDKKEPHDMPKRLDYKVAGSDAEATSDFSDWNDSTRLSLPEKLAIYSPILTDAQWSGKEKATPAIEYLFDYSEYDAKIDSGRFYLTHYGLPEPESFANSNRALYLAIAVIGFFCVCFFIIWRKTSKRT